MADGARASELARLLGMGLTTLQRWRRQFAGNGDGLDGRKGSHYHVPNRLSKEERQRILLACNEPEFAALPPGQIVPVLAPIAGFISAQSAASTGCCTPMDKPIAAVGHGHHRSPERFHACGPQGRIRCGAGASPICPPPCAVCGCTCTWSSTSGAERWWPGMSPSARIQPLQRIW
jgi:Helix-turn-helix domain